MDTASEASADRGPVGGGIDASGLVDKRRVENFPVALRVLPRRYRVGLVNVYDVARTIDDLGDVAAGDRVALLEQFDQEMAGIWQGRTPTHPVLRRLAGTVAAHHLEREPFERLVRANLVDQRVCRYRTYQRLRSYCRLSAEPVGRLVLALFDAASLTTVALSDQVCTALQIVEHCQDLAEDRRAGRIYLPISEMLEFGLSNTALDAPSASAALRRLLGFQLDRASELLNSGTPLLGVLHGWARLAIDGYVAGGRATIDAIRRINCDVLASSARPRRRDVARHLARLLRRATGRPARVGPQ